MFEDPVFIPGGGSLVAKSCPAFVTPWAEPARLLCPWDFPGKNTRVGCHFLLQKWETYLKETG